MMKLITCKALNPVYRKLKLFIFAILLFTFNSAISQNSDVIKSCNVIAKCILSPDFRSSNYESAKIKKGETVEVLDFDGSVYKVRFKGKVGFINKVFIYDEELNELLTKRDAEREAKEIEERRLLEEERMKKEEERKLKIKEIELKKQLAAQEKKQWEEKRKKRLVEKYGEYKGLLMIQKQVRIGWTEAEVLESIGEPTDINKTSSVYGSTQQWVYRKENVKTKYLYFENGKVTTIQD